MFSDFYKSWRFLYDHPMFQDTHDLKQVGVITISKFQDCLDIEVVKVNPAINSVDDDASKNTKTEVWLEAGRYDKTCRWHDIDLDCGGNTFEEAIINLANNVLEQYGNEPNRIKPSSLDSL